MDFKPEYSPKNWEEDYSHENGMYQNHCFKCHCTFFGHKRRVICKKCADIGDVKLKILEESFRVRMINKDFKSFQKTHPTLIKVILSAMTIYKDRK